MSSAIEQSLKDRLRSLAAAEQRSFNELWRSLVLERFLARLACSVHRERLIFKGGMLLAQYIRLGRETIDLDFLLLDSPASVDLVLSIFEAIAKEALHDGFEFRDVNIAEVRQLTAAYPGYSVGLLAHCGSTRTKLTLDVGIGDTVIPAELSVALLESQKGPFFEEEISLRVYPLEAVFAEKYETACSRGAANSRMKDFHDMLLILRSQENLESTKLREALVATFAHRNTPFSSLTSLLAPEVDRFERDWRRHLNTLADDSLRTALPGSFRQVLGEISERMKIHVPELGE